MSEIEKENSGIMCKYKALSLNKRFIIWISSAFLLLALVAIVCIIVDSNSSFSMNWYGFLIGGAIVLCVVAGQYAILKNGYYEDMVFDHIVFALPCAILGARLYYVIFDMIGGGYWTFSSFWNFSNGGLAVYGGLIGTGVGVAIARLVYNHFTKRPKIKFLQMMDIGFTFVPIGQAIGRWGCYFAGCCYGVEITDTAWQFFPFAYQPLGRTTWHLATFFFESVFCTILFIVLFIFLIGKRKSFVGFNFSVYCIGYGICRATLEMFRADTETLYLIPGILPASIFTSMAIFTFGVIWIARHLIRAKMHGKKVMILVPLDKLSDDYLDYEKTIYAETAKAELAKSSEQMQDIGSNKEAE